jgi:hypothetical protein
MTGLASVPDPTGNPDVPTGTASASAGLRGAPLPETITMDWVKEFHEQLDGVSWRPLHELRETLPAQRAIQLLSAAKALLAKEPTLIQVRKLSHNLTMAG